MPSKRRGLCLIRRSSRPSGSHEIPDGVNSDRRVAEHYRRPSGPPAYVSFGTGCVTAFAALGAPAHSPPVVRFSRTFRMAILPQPKWAIAAFASSRSWMTATSAERDPWYGGNTLCTLEG